MGIIGLTASDFDVEVIDRKGGVSESTLLSLRPAGKVLVVDFFAPWCKACPAKARELEELAKSDRGNDSVFVLVSVDGGVDGARDFAKAHGIEQCIVAAAVDDDAPA